MTKAPQCLPLDGGGLPSCSAAEAVDRQEPFVNPTLANHALAVWVFPQNFDLTLWIFRKQERSGLHFSLPDVHILIHNICRTVHADQVLSCRVRVDRPLLAAHKNQPRIALGLPESGHRREKAPLSYIER